MSRCVCYILTLGIVLGALAETSAGPPEGFVSLFNGKDLTGWRGMRTQSPDKIAAQSEEERAKEQAEDNEDLKKHWYIENGELVNDGQGVYASPEKDYGSFELMLEFKTVPIADSGIYLRGNPQVQIWDTTESSPSLGNGAAKGSGALWNNKKGERFPLVKADKPFGEWNSFNIKMVGERVTVTLNDKLVVDDVVMENYWNAENPIPASGPIQLQTHGGEIRWRNIYIRELESPEE